MGVVDVTVVSVVDVIVVSLVGVTVVSVVNVSHVGGESIVVSVVASLLCW